MLALYIVHSVNKRKTESRNQTNTKLNISVRFEACALFDHVSVQKSGGTQLKLVITFSNYGEALFKPMK